MSNAVWSRTGPNRASNRLPLIIVGVGLAVLALGIAIWVVVSRWVTVPSGDVAVSAIVSQPEAHVGDSVMVRGIAGDVLVPGWAFTLHGENRLADELLIVARERFVGSGSAANSGRVGGLPNPGELANPDYPLGPSAPLEIRGTVQRFDVAEAERLTGTNLDDDLRGLFAAELEDWQGRPVLYADQITFVR